MTKKQPKLSDLQLILLSTASQRDDGNLLPLPAAAGSDKERTDRAVAVLLAGGFVNEVGATDSAIVWRENEDKRFVISITDVGRTVIGTSDDIPSDPKPADDGAELQIGSQPELPAISTPRSGSKQALLLEMLARQNGATIDELIAATGWLPHTTRAAISGVRKRGQQVSNERKKDGISRYRLAEVTA